MSSDQLPLCTDLDGTLVRGDTLWEQCLVLIKRNPLNVFRILLWVRLGKAAFKDKVTAAAGLIQAATMPYHPEFLAYLKEQHRKGRILVLCTAANVRIGLAVARSLGFFQDVLASDAKTNLSGRRKADVLKEKFGEKGFVYAGNGRVDLPVWQIAKEVIVVNAPKSVVKEVKRSFENPLIFDDRKNLLKVILKACRIKQWIKSLLLFIPLVLGHEITNTSLVLRTALLFLSFGLVASSTYLLNDMFDIPSDRLHLLKRGRPFASGDLGIPLGLLLGPPFLIAGFTIAYFLSPESFMVLSLYFAMTLLYSWWLKRVLLIDVIMLAMLYTIRIFAGGIVTGVEISTWLLIFSLFFFTSLALVKRFSELQALPEDKGRALSGRGYLRPDLQQLATLGTGCGLISVLVIALYINSPKVSLLYSQPQMLWFICPLLLYWIGRVWLIANRGFMPDDPIVFAITDPKSYLVVVLLGICLVLATIL